MTKSGKTQINKGFLNPIQLSVFMPPNNAINTVKNSWAPKPAYFERLFLESCILIGRLFQLRERNNGGVKNQFRFTGQYISDILPIGFPALHRLLHFISPKLQPCQLPALSLIPITGYVIFQRRKYNQRCCQPNQ